MRQSIHAPIADRGPTSIFCSCERIAKRLQNCLPDERIAVFLFNKQIRAIDASADGAMAGAMSRYTLVGVYDHKATAEQIADDVEACG